MQELMSWPNFKNAFWLVKRKEVNLTNFIQSLTYSYLGIDQAFLVDTIVTANSYRHVC